MATHTTSSVGCLLVTIFILAFLFTHSLEFSDATFTASSNISSCFKSERNALLDLKHSLVDEFNRLSSWTGDDCCKWEGIRCSRRTGHVVKVDLHNPVDLPYQYRHMLRGDQLNSSLQNLKHLTHLDLSYNNFSGIQIPDFFGSLVNLRYLNLSYSSFAGNNPHHLGNLSRLQYLDLSYNYYIQNIDSLWWVSQLYSLKQLDLSLINLSKATNWFQAMNMLPSLSVLKLINCKLDYYNIPAHSDINFTSLVSLELELNFENNMLTIPRWLSNITGLVKLDLRENNFKTYAPNTLSKLTNLVHLDLSSNMLEGPIPTDIGNLTKLRYLGLGDNKLTGNIQLSFEKLSFLESLVLARNQLKGNISDNFFNHLTRLELLDLTLNTGVTMNFSSTWTPPFQLKHLRLHSCKVGPGFPHWLRNQRNFNLLELSNTSIADNIPNWFSSVTISAQYLDLSENNLTGNLLLIPSNLVQLDVSNNLLSGLHVANTTNSIQNSSLRDIHAANNLLSGVFPTWLCNMKSIHIIDLSNNQLSGRLPSCLGSLENLGVLDLTNNSFSSSIPSSLGSLPFLSYIHLRDNKFEGPLPSSFQNLTRLVTLDVAHNAIIGAIPPWISQRLPNLKVLHLQSNRLNGPIPQQLCQLSRLQIINLASNKICGSIPSCFSNLSAMVRNDPSSPFSLTTHESDYDFRTGYKEEISEGIEGMERKYNAAYFISMDLSDNNITGVIPNELMELLALVKLNVSANHIEGRIPDQIGNLRQLLSLDVSRNKLTGPIPESLSFRNLRQLLSLDSYYLLMYQEILECVLQ